MAMEAQTSSSPPFSTAGLGPCELSCFHSIQSCFSWLHYHHWVFWSTCGTDGAPCVRSRLAATADCTLTKNKIKRCLQLLTQSPSVPCLIQFWGLVKNGDQMYLTACDQPFAILNGSYYQDVFELCEYRKHCLKYLIRTVDDDEISVDGAQQLIGGPPGRVFRSGLPEYARDVRDYTSTEYPLRDCAVGCVGKYWVLPVYHHPTQHLPSGVLEIASLSGSYNSGFAWNAFVEMLRDALQEANLTPPGVSRTEISSCQDGEIAKIDEALCALVVQGLDHTQIWTTSEEILSSEDGIYFTRKGQGVVGKAFSSKSACFCRDVSLLSTTEYPFLPIARHNRRSACFAVCLQSSCSNNCIYVLEFFLPMNEFNLWDPRKLLNMLMETLKQRLQSSFRIAPGQGLGEKLTVEVIKVSPKDEFDCFEICSTTSIESTPRLGEVQGGEAMMQPDFSSQQVDAANGSTNCTHEQQNASVGSTPRLANTQGGEGMTQVDFSSQQVDTANACVNGVPRQQSGIGGSTPRSEHVQDFVNISYQESMAVQLNASNFARVDAANNSINSIYEQQNGIVGSSPRREIVQNIENIAHDEPSTEINVANPERGGASIEQSGNGVMNIKKRKSICTLQHDLEITREVLEQNSWRNLEDAAKVLEVSRSTLKRICREYGIHRWPPHQVFAAKRVVRPSTENIEEHHQPDTTRAEDDCSIWVKAKYQGHTMKFRLPLSARKFNLEEEVAQRLNCLIGSFKIEYLDEEDDWIWIACDKDLSTCMSTLSSLGRKTIKMKVEGSHIREP